MKRVKIVTATTTIVWTENVRTLKESIDYVEKINDSRNIMKKLYNLIHEWFKSVKK